MKDKQQIWYVMFCDKWNTHDSERLQMLTTDPIKAREFIYKAILAEDIEYGDVEKTSIEQGISFLHDWERLTSDEINSELTYCYYDYSYDGDEM